MLVGFFSKDKVLGPAPHPVRLHEVPLTTLVEVYHRVRVVLGGRAGGAAGVRVGEESAGVHLCGEGERHGVGGDHGGGHAVDPRVLGQRPVLAPPDEGARHGVTPRLVQAPVRPLASSLTGNQR